MKKIILSVLLLGVITSASAQYLAKFSKDTSLYIEELTQLFGTSLMDEEDIVFADFIATWDSLDHGYRVDIMEISQHMLERTCRPRPHYIMFLRILEEFHREGKLDYGYDEFISAYKAFMADKNTLLAQINKANQTIFLLLDELKFYSSVSLDWSFREADFRFSNKNGLRIETTGNTIVGLSSGDSIEIHKVVGYVNPVTQQFIGSSGRVYWDRAGLDPSIVYADLKYFKIDLKRTEYKADSVLFYHTQLLDGPALGTLNDRISQFRSPEQALFPDFTTYQSSYTLNNIFEGVDYKGAIGMRGANLAGTASEGVDAEVKISYNDTVRVFMTSRVFLFGKNIMRSNNARVSIYVESDSIYHPDLVMNYHTGQELLRLTRSKDYNSQGPYSNSYHRIDMNFDELNWIRSEPVIRLQAALGTALGNGSFESYDFFNLDFYESLQAMEYQHPLAELWNYSKMLGGTTFAVEPYAAYQGKAPYMYRQQLMEFSKLGFVYFDFEADLVTLRPKLFDYIDASLMKRDYDVIRFVSRTEAGTENATLNLSTKDLTINGIPTIFLSDSQNVKLVPANNQIVMKRNRDFQFDGAIDAGLFKFYGKNFFFEYDNFRINLQNIDSLSISAKTGQKDNYGNDLTTTLDNTIENITGELLIDAPFNKSGLENFPEYPVFTSRENSYVYFDEESIQDGVYDRERFYFQLFPFSIDSLDNFQREALRMEGTFISADILPPMEMEMSLRPDNSLGFYMQTPSEGLDIYGGKALFHNDIEMSSAGLHGYGSMDYISSTTFSDDFLFHPDSLMTTSREFKERETRAQVSYPLVENGITDIRYYPYKDVMHIDRVETAFKMFNDSTRFGGDLSLRPAGLSGRGRLNMPDARLESEVFKFQAQRVLADSAGTMFRRTNTEDFTFITNDIKLDLDLVKREGDFQSRQDYTLIDMPLNLYETRLDQFTWFMDKDQVRMKMNKKLMENNVDIGIDSLKMNAPSYVSKHPQQDSLNFVSPLAFFNYSQKILDAEEVPFMAIGDSYVFPKAGKVQVLEKATITPLKGAKIMANTDSRFHLMHDANLVVDSRLHFRGSADYDYEDEFGDIYTFHFSHVEVDTSIQTFAKGEIKEEEGFMLSPFFEYQGAVSMLADDPFLDFAGGVRLTHNCDLNKNWLKFETRIDPDSIMIPVEEKLQNIQLNNIFAGTLKARDSIHIYPTFMSGRKDYFDRNVTFSSGYLYYDKSINAYEIATEEKLRDMNSEGNYLALYTDSCKLYSEGEIDLQLEYGRMDMKTIGYAYHDIPENDLDLRLMMGLDFHFSPEILNYFGHELDSLPDLSPVNLTTPFYKKGVKNFVGEALADKMETELGLYGSYTVIPDSMKFSMLFSDMTLKWNQETRSYRYNGKVGIGTIGDIQVNKYVDAYIEFVERGSGDIFDIYLMVDDNTWYYLAFSPGALQVLSSNRDFNQMILDIPEKERKLKSRGRRKSYIYSLASNRRLSLFLDKFMMFEGDPAAGDGE